MYRDEVLAIGEAVREARRDGIETAKQFYTGKLSQVRYQRERFRSALVSCAAMKIPSIPDELPNDKAEQAETWAQMVDQCRNEMRRIIELGKTTAASMPAESDDDGVPF